MQLKAHYLQHVPFEGPGYIYEWLLQHNCKVSSTKLFHETFEFPDPASIDLLVILGGPMNVYETDKYPWLAEEKQFVADFLRGNKKILGICLGAQLIANCLGAKIYPARHKEIGWFPVKHSGQAKSPIWFRSVFADEPVVLHWHGDTFDIPEGAINLLSSEGNTNQAFIHGTNTLGLQFHLEATKSTLDQLLNHAAADLNNSLFVQDQNGIRAGHRFLKECNACMAEILKSFLAIPAEFSDRPASL